MNRDNAIQRVTPRHSTIIGLVSAAAIGLMLNLPETALGAVPKVDTTEAGIRQLIDDISEGSNADTLKYVYFLRRERGMFDKEAALKVVTERMGQLDEGVSNEWFLLASVRAFALANLPGLTGAEHEYTRIFRHSEVLAQHPETMQRVLSDFIAKACRTTVTNPKMDDDTVRGMFERAIPCWLAVNVCVRREPDLARLAKAYDVIPQMEKLVEDSAKDFGGDLSFLRRAGLCMHGLGADSAEKGMHYLMLAVAHRAFEEQSVSLRREVLDALVDCCLTLNKIDLAVRYQTDSVARAGGSRAVLAAIYQRTSDVPSRDRVVEAACADLRRRHDVVPLAKFLIGLKCDAQAARLLEAFLAQPKQHDEHELAATVELVKLYCKNGKSTEIRNLVQSVQVEDYSRSPSVIAYLAVIRKFRAADLAQEDGE